MMGKISQISIGVLTLFAASSVWSATYTWDFSSTAPIFGAADTGSCGPATGTGSSAACEMIFMSTNGGVLRARAYSTTQPNTGTSATKYPLVSGQIARWSGNGLGVQNVSEGSSPEAAPEHAVDNRDRYDVIVFEAPEENFDWTTFKIGWAGDSTTSPVTDSNPEVQMWAGNGSQAGLDFSTMCLSSSGTGCSNSNNITNTASGFTSLGVFNNTAAGVDPNGKGRYLVVSGALASSYGFDDAFKIKSLTGMPEPGVLALLGLGFLGILRVRSRCSGKLI